MFALLRASNPLRSRLHCGLRAAAAPLQSYHTNSNILDQISQAKSNNLHQNQLLHRNLFTFRCFNSQSDTRSNGEEDVEDGFSELDDPSTKEEEEEVRSVPFDLFSVVASCGPPKKVSAALDKFVEEIKALDHAEIRQVLLNLRKCKLCGFAYELLNWLELKQIFVCQEESHYVARLGWIAKRCGMALADKYVKAIPETYRGVKVYETLLSNYVTVGDVKNAEQVFEKMRELGFPLSEFACQQMIHLYRAYDKKKIRSVLLLMEENDVKPTRFTYKLLMDVKGEANDIAGMEELVEALKSDGLELDNFIRAVLARHYIVAGFDEKARKILKEMEGEDLEKNRGVRKRLLLLYAALGKADEVERIWKVCESDGRVGDYSAAISAFGKVDKVEKAEEIFEKGIKSGTRISLKCFESLLNVYVDHKLLAKGKDLVKRMGSDSHPIVDTLVKLYVDAGEVEKADSVLQNAMQQRDKRMKPPLYKSFHVIMEQYSRRGDVHNTEKMFHHLRQSGYASNIRDYQSLLQAYIKAEVPAYGFRERMMADNLIPNKVVAGQLAQVDPFKKTRWREIILRNNFSIQ